MPLDLSQLAEELRLQNDALATALGNVGGSAHSLLSRLADEIAGSGQPCGYCGRPGAAGASCVSCGAYVAAPKPMARPEPPQEPTLTDVESYGDELPDFFTQISLILALAALCLLFIGLP